MPVMTRLLPLLLRQTRGLNFLATMKDFAGAIGVKVVVCKKITRVQLRTVITQPHRLTVADSNVSFERKPEPLFRPT